MTVSFNREDTERFLAALYGDLPEGCRFLIWTLPKKLSMWFGGGEGIGEALNYVERVWNDKDVYVGAGVASKDYGLTQRCPAKEIAGIASLWMDLDVSDPVHKKPNLPGSVEGVIELLDELGAEPTFLIHSGHGVQAWWVLQEPWIFADDAERQKAAQLSAAWIANAQIRAKKRGWVIDPVMDLSRIMRLPGTCNRKRDPVPVRVIKDSGKRYSIDDLSGFILDDAWRDAERHISITEAAEMGVLKLNPEAHPPYEKHDAILENDDRYRKTWEHRRKDMTDQSPSGYDLALANIVARAGWSDQEIADLLIAHRRKYGADLKLREGYYAHTILLARSAPGVTEERRITEALDRAIGVSKDPEVDPEAKRRTALKTVSDLIGIEIVKFVRYLSEPPSYRIYFSNGKSVSIPSTRALRSQDSFAEALIDGCNYVMPRFKVKRWDDILKLLIQAQEEVDVTEEATEGGILKGQLRQYLSEKPPIDDRDAASDPHVHRPFTDEGDIYIFTDNFITWLKNSFRESLTSQKLCTRLDTFGGKPKVFPKRVRQEDGTTKNTSFRAWRIPKGLVE